MESKRALVVYYSRTGMTKKVAEAIADELGCDLEELIDKKKRRGPVGFAVAAKDAALKKAARIEEPQKDPASYDLVVVGTPVWANTMSCAARTYFDRTKDTLPDVAFFVTTAHSGIDRTFRHMKDAAGKAPVATLSLFAKEVRRDEHRDKVKAFVGKLGGNTSAI